MSFSHQIVIVLVWVIIPIFNFSVWFYIGAKSSSSLPCPEASTPIVEITADNDCPVGTFQNPSCYNFIEPKYKNPHLSMISTRTFDSYRAKTLATMNYPGNSQTLILKGNEKEVCRRYLHELVSMHHTRGQCFATVRINNITADYNVLRFENDIDEAGYSVTLKEAINARIKDPKIVFKPNAHNEGKLRPSGYFRKIPKERGRERIYMKMHPFLRHFNGKDGVVETLRNKLKSNGFKPGDDIIVMVVNEGEIDLYLNFACSCRLHHISMKNVLVFAASSEIVRMIESTGAMGIYHQGYGEVSKKASKDYLDRVFVDMMWYKAFSVYLLLRDRYNILFQDADLVWFREPFQYFKDVIQRFERHANMTGSYLEAFLSDDGQRSLRYAPFYGNSGFYYLLGNERSERFAWSIMAAFDAVQVLGSHQNVFTTKLVEGLGLSHKNVMILPLDDFPNGILYHHNRGYMNKLKQGKVKPYNFHMCWTQGKPDKLIYLRKASMWYLTEKCSPLEALINKGAIFDHVLEHHNRPELSVDERWDRLSDMCCHAMPNAP